MSLEAREQPSFSFATLEHGQVHYRLEGSEDAPLVVLVHGMGVPLFVWQPLAERLLQAGFRVLRFDLYGRGRSDKPSTPHNPSLFEGQLWQLLEALELKKPVHLVGSSMGGAISVFATSQKPEWVRSLTMISPAGTKLAMPWTSKILRMKLVSGLIPKNFAKRTYLSKIRENFFDESYTDDFIAKLLHQMDDPGFFEALLSTLRNFPLSDMEETYRAVGKMELPTLLLWGTHDKIVPYANHEAVLTTMPEIQFHTIENCGHVPHYEKPDEVAPKLVAFLQELES